MTTPWLMPVRELVRFFIWWGFEIPKSLFLAGWNFFLVADDNLRLLSNLKLWLMFEPMFGDNDWKGHLVGFLLRGVITLTSAVVYLVLLGLTLVLPLVWYLVTIAALVMIF
jgi:hypothetical protein